MNNEPMLTEFGKIFFFFFLAIIFVVMGLFTARLIRPSRPTKEKLLTYECGEDSEGSSWIKFNIRFYVIALIFIIFDVELVLLVPWLLVYKEIGFTAFLIGFIFMFLLAAGMVYEWKKGDLEWARPQPVRPVLNRTIKPLPENALATQETPSSEVTG